MSRPGLILAVVVITPLVIAALIGVFRKGPRAGASLSRAGLMELQNLLEPERKVEIVREMESKQDLLVSVDGQGDGGRPPSIRIRSGRTREHPESRRPVRPT